MLPLEIDKDRRTINGLSFEEIQASPQSRWLLEDRLLERGFDFLVSGKGWRPVFDMFEQAGLGQLLKVLAVRLLTGWSLADSVSLYEDYRAGG